ncbi:hypothetical protein QUB80_11725 [Chlorogloeopsis sp. ULAP01]|uniref:hypothetical protein n=1 Tax=Chlorogloeopsis sp. ULAP01 TaxID=3056483 RepID=UPI0025AA7606|nr:hypothetical protein [Chlorogloeopsis sp. ULAP01]MDM9381372.1 hypothetical protein [Chlorogloeopsis sp. ULAP01]
MNIIEQNILFYIAIIIYLVMTYCFFTNWLEFFRQDKDMNPAERLFSGVILVIATILWPIIVPFAYLELLRFHKKHKQSIDKLINESTSSFGDR